MSASLKTNLTTPVGRIVMGSLYRPNDKDAEGKLLVVKTGANAGQPRVNFFFAIAIPKEPGHTHWSQTVWGAEIWRVGHTAFPGVASRPDFAWKVDDGDSTIPNKKNKRPCDNEGWAGNWIVKFSSGHAPKVYQADPSNPQGWAQVMQEDFVKAGYFVQVQGNVDGNGSTSQPGVYLNHQTVAFRAYGQEISFGPSVSEAGFGAAPLPAGASAVPLASANPMPAAVPAAPPTVPAASPAHTASASTPPPPPVPVTPNAAFLQVPVAPVAPVPVAAVPSVPVVPTPPSVTSPSKVMTAKAGGASYASFIEGGWDDARMIAEGYLSL